MFAFLFLIFVFVGHKMQSNQNCGKNFSLSFFSRCRKLYILQRVVHRINRKKTHSQTPTYTYVKWKSKNEKEKKHTEEPESTRISEWAHKNARVSHTMEQTQMQTPPQTPAYIGF